MLSVTTTKSFRVVVVIVVLVSILATLVTPTALAASPVPVQPGQPAAGSAASAKRPDVPALTCVALDMSGSMNTTDPEHYGPSVVDLLGDLASKSNLVVLTFSGIGSQGITTIGTFNLASPDELEALRRKVSELSQAPREGETPTAALVSAIFQHLEDQNAPPGSGCIIISDGQPEPAPDDQYAEIEKRLPDFSKRNWKLHAIALGPGDWGPRFSEMATKLGGIALSANTPKELISVILHVFSTYRSDPPPQVQPMTIGADGTASLPIDLDPTIKRLTVVVTRPDASVTARLLTPQQAEVNSGDSRLIGFNAEDPHYIFSSLSSSSALGAGSWTLEIQGAPGTQVFAGISQRSSLSLAITEPKGGLFLANRPGRLCVQLQDDARPLPDPSAAMELTMDGGQRMINLQDDGRSADSGDELARDGTFCGWLTLVPGSHQFAIRATTSGNGSAGTEGSLFAESFPGFQPLPMRETPEVHDGDSPAVRLAQLDLNGGRVDPNIVRQLTLIVQPPNGEPEKRLQLDPKMVLDAEGVLTVAFPAYVRDAIDPTARNDNGSVTVPYKLIVQAGYERLGQVVTDDVAIDQTISVSVLPYPGLCPSFFGPVRGACAQVIGWSPLPWIIAGIVALVGTLVLFGFAIFFMGRRQRGGDTTSLSADDW